MPLRVNGNALYHEIIALPPNDEIPVPEQRQALLHLAQMYLERRATQHLAIGVIHTETDSLHIHLMISSNGVLSRKREWLHKREFAEIQRELEAYRIEHYPRLGKERYYAGDRRQARLSQREQTLCRRTGKPTQKQQLITDLREILATVNDHQTLDAALAGKGLELYQRGRSVGVMTSNNRRYRFCTLGLAHEYTDALARIDLIASRYAMLNRNGEEAEYGRER